MAEQRRPMARSCRCALFVAVLVLLFHLVAFTGLRALAQAPDYEEFSLPADTEVSCDEFFLPADSELEEGDCLVPAETEVAGEELLLGGPPPRVDIVVPPTVPWAGAIDTGTSLTAYAYGEGGELKWSATGPGQATFSGQESVALAQMPAEDAAYGPTQYTTHMTVTEGGQYAVKATYTVDADSATDTKDPIVVVEADLQMAGLDEEDEEDPGGFLLLGGPRRKVELVLRPEALPGGPPEEPPEEPPAEPPA